jgi:hypothetical protein
MDRLAVDARPLSGPGCPRCRAVVGISGGAMRLVGSRERENGSLMVLFMERRSGFYPGILLC